MQPFNENNEELKEHESKKQGDDIIHPTHI